MKIINPAVEADIAEKRPLKLDLGAGNSPRPGYYAVDNHPGTRPDIAADLSRPLALLPDACASHVYSRHTLEHVDDMIQLMNEVHRVCMQDAEVEIIVPHFSNVFGYSDPTHVRLFGIYSMFYFCPPAFQPERKVPAYYSSARFMVKKVELHFYRRGIVDRLVAPLLTRCVNESLWTQELYERRFSSILHAWQIRFQLTPIKNQLPSRGPE